MRLSKLSCTGTQALPGVRISQQLRHCLRQRPEVEEIDQPTRLVMDQRFTQRCRVTGHDGAAYAHGLQQAPTQNEWIGEVDMYRRQLKQLNEEWVWQVTQEMHTVPVMIRNVWAHFINKLLDRKSVV